MKVDKGYAIEMHGRVPIYEVVRHGSRMTTYYYTDLKSALAKYDELCIKHKGNGHVDLVRWNTNGYQYAYSTLYTSFGSSIIKVANVEYRNVAKYNRK